MDAEIFGKKKCVDISAHAGNTLKFKMGAEHFLRKFWMSTLRLMVGKLRKFFALTILLQM
jgi:hypothetical protein